MKILFVGERRSQTAQEKGWTWRDGRLAAKTLFEALRAIAVEPTEHAFCNLWADDSEDVTYYRERMLRAVEQTGGRIIVALGAKVAAELRRLEIAHVALIHPAARGTIRGRGRYAAHVREVLAPALSSARAVA